MILDPKEILLHPPTNLISFVRTYPYSKQILEGNKFSKGWVHHLK